MNTTKTNNLTICITGAGGQISYSLIPQLLKGFIFPGVYISLKLLDIAPSMRVLKGVVMEIKDSTYPFLESVVYGDNPLQMFKDCDVVVFLGGFPRKPGM